MDTTTGPTTEPAEPRRDPADGTSTGEQEHTDRLLSTARRRAERAAKLTTPHLETELIAVNHRISRTTAELLILLGEIDRRGSWKTAGSLSCSSWLATVCDVDIGTARTQLRIARAMRHFPDLADAITDGRISYSKARTLAPHLTAENVDELIALAEAHPANRLGAAIAAWSSKHENPEDRDERHRRERRLSWRTDPDGMITFIARVPPAEAGALIAAIDHTVMDGAPDPDPHETHRSRPSHADAGDDGFIAEGDGGASADAPESRPQRRSLAQQRVDALVERVIENRAESGAAPQPELVIHVRGDTNTLADGTPLTDHAVTSLLPESFISLLVRDMKRRPVDASPRRRAPTRRQRRIVDERHPTCAHPGCNAQAFLQYDHIQPHAEGGPTVVDNLRRLCGPHNRVRND